MKKYSIDISKPIVVMILVASLLLISLFVSEMVLKAWPFLGKWYSGEKHLLQKQVNASQSFWPSLFIARIVIYATIFCIGLFTTIRFSWGLCSKLSKKMPRSYKYGIFTSFVCILLISFLLTAIGLKYCSFYGPGGTTLFYGSAPPLKVNQITIADENGMNSFNPKVKHLYYDVKINQQGFLSPFNYTKQFCDSLKKSGKKLVFIVGDSFVEGVSDADYSTVFTELIRESDTSIVLCNFGIGGTDPLNYKLIVEKYVPLLNPDLVVIAFCWNDVMDYDRQPTPNIPMYYGTNIGLLASNIPYTLAGKHNTILPTAQEAYNYYKDWYFINPTENRVASLCSRTTITSMLYTKTKRKAKYIDPDRSKFNGTISYRHLKTMEGICFSNGCKMAIAFIPDISKVDKLKTLEANHKEYAHIFHDYLPKVHFVENSITRADYISDNNQHFTAVGNAKYATFLKGIINKEL